VYIFIVILWKGRILSTCWCPGINHSLSCAHAHACAHFRHVSPTCACPLSWVPCCHVYPSITCARVFLCTPNLYLPYCHACLLPSVHTLLSSRHASSLRYVPSFQSYLASCQQFVPSFYRWRPPFTHVRPLQLLLFQETLALKFT
jgi:hypothetical protein